MPISAITSTSSAISFAGGLSGVDSEYEKIKKMLMALGYTPSGDKATDKAKLKKVQEAKQKSAQKSQQTGMQESGNKPILPWEDTMRTLGLEPQGSKDKDYELVMKTLDKKASTAKNDSDKQYYTSMKQTAEKLFAQDGNSASSANASAMVGASYMAELNKQLLIS